MTLDMDMDMDMDANTCIIIMRAFQLAFDYATALFCSVLCILPCASLRSATIIINNK